MTYIFIIKTEHCLIPFRDFYDHLFNFNTNQISQIVEFWLLIPKWVRGEYFSKTLLQKTHSTISFEPQRAAASVVSSFSSHIKREAVLIKPTDCCHSTHLRSSESKNLPNLKLSLSYLDEMSFFFLLFFCLYSLLCVCLLIPVCAERRTTGKIEALRYFYGLEAWNCFHIGWTLQHPISGRSDQTLWFQAWGPHVACTIIHQILGTHRYRVLTREVEYLTCKMVKLNLDGTIVLITYACICNVQCNHLCKKCMQ